MTEAIEVAKRLCNTFMSIDERVAIIERYASDCVAEVEQRLQVSKDQHEYYRSKTSECMGVNIQLAARVAELEKALNELLDRYTGMVNSGDCGNWNPETEDCVIKARAAMKEDK